MGTIIRESQKEKKVTTTQSNQSRFKSFINHKDELLYIEQSNNKTRHFFFHFLAAKRGSRTDRETDAEAPAQTETRQKEID